jgi:tryptophan synthase alpha chain
MNTERKNTNRIKTLFQTPGDKLAIYFTAGYPNLENTMPIIKALSKGGCDLIEVGMPYSDPLADGETIQQSSMKALQNGMRLSVLFEQLKELRKQTEVPVVLMGYLNNVMQYGAEKFCQQAQEAGVDGLILPDLPIIEYEQHYKALFEKYGLSITFLITPQTPYERMQQIDEATTGFVYVVSSASITGGQLSASDERKQYLKKVQDMQLQSPTMVGFGISDANGYQLVNNFGHGAIIGSAFIRMLAESKDVEKDTVEFVKRIKS